MGNSPDWGKRGAIAAYVIGIPSIVLAAIAYLRPPDPAHPIKFDFLSTTLSVSIPLWLLALTVIILLTAAFFAVRAYTRKTSPPPQPSGHTPNPPVAMMATKHPDRPPIDHHLDYSPFRFDPEQKLLRLNAGEVIALEIDGMQSGTLGFTLAAVNTSSKVIASYQIEVSEAKSWSQAHQEFLDNPRFNRKPVQRGANLEPVSKANGQWLIRVVSTPKGQTLTLYNDDSTPLVWPNDDLTGRETWRLTLVSVYVLKPQDPTITALPICYLLVRWDRKNSTLAIAPYNPDAIKTPNTLLPSDPRLSIVIQEDTRVGTFRSGATISIKNVGGSEAHSIALQDIAVGEHTVTFPAVFPVLNPGDSTPPITGRISDYSPLLQHDLAGAMLDAWNDKGDIELKHMGFPASATYSDYQGNNFRATWTYQFLPLKCRIKRLHQDKKPADRRQIIHATGLLAEKNQNYAAAALIRQVVEIEYLTWAFKEGHVDLEHWLKSTHEDRRKVFSPASLRQTSKGRFLDKDYRRHCEQGGHPTPEGIHLLIPGPSFQILLADLLTHSWRIWDQTRAWSAMRPETIAITEKFMHMVYKPLADWGKQDKIYALMVEQRPESQYP